MIITQLLGGLGNQLFQYAVGRALAARHGVPLRLDISQFKDYPSRKYALDPFNISASLMTAEEWRQVDRTLVPWGTSKHMLQRAFRSSAVPLVREQTFKFDSRVLAAPATCVLQGYWQSPKYFAAIEPQIRKEFTLREPLSLKNLEISRQIRDSAAVSLHVRRGDYVENAHTNRYHGTCAAEYYATAEQTLRDKLGQLRLFVFSDDADWAETSLQFACPTTIVRHNGPERDYEDLRLMTLCRHHIIANSTFSWWGAWLCKHPDKIVIAPRDWFREAGHDTSDLIPQEWIRL